MESGDFLIRRSAALLACLALACGDGPTVPGALATIRVTPDPLLVNSIGQLITLEAVGLDANGTEIPGLTFDWLSSDPTVASVNSEGIVSTHRNGAVTIVASAQGVSGQSQITIEQEAAGLIFPNPPHAVLIGQAIPEVTVALADPSGNVVRDATGTVMLDVASGSPGSLQGGARTAEMRGGIARFTNVLPSGGGFGWRVRALYEGLAATSGEFDVVTAFDRVTTSGSSPIGVLVDGLAGNVVLDDEGFVASSTGTNVGAVRPASATNEVILFGRNRPPTLVENAPWTLGVDTIPVPARGDLRIDLTIWIVKGPFSTQRARAVDAVQTTLSIWTAQNVGVEFGAVEYLDATGDSDASTFYSFDGCGRRADMEQRIGHKSGRLNIYYVERVDGGTSRGRACPIGGDFAVMAESSGDELLSHEIGHLFSLTHIDHLTGDFDRSNVMHSASSVRQYFTEAQIYRAHFNPNSAINQHLGLRPGEPQRSCAREQVSTICPRIALRLWGDGDFPANGVGTDAEAPPLLAARDSGEATAPSAVVERFLDMTCADEENATLDARVAALGDAALPTLRAALAEGGSSRALAAAHGLALVGTPDAVALLTELRDSGAGPVAREAGAQLERVR